MAPAAKEQENGGREDSKEEINKGEKDEMTTMSTTTLSELGRRWALMCVSLLTSLPLRNRVLAIKNTEDSFLLSSFLLPFLDQHDTSLECWITIEPLCFILGLF